MVVDKSNRKSESLRVFMISIWINARALSSKTDVGMFCLTYDKNKEDGFWPSSSLCDCMFFLMRCFLLASHDEYQTGKGKD